MIDSTLFAADIATGSYSVGDMIPLKLVEGPGNVRSGRGAAILKRLTTGQLLDASGSSSNWKIYVKNSDWIDPMTSLAASIRAPTALDERTGQIQRGHDCVLTPNSSWEVYAVCTVASTTTVANSIFALIDIDYPSVSSIVNPDELAGIPATIETSHASIPYKAGGTLTTSNPTVVNVDFFKAGFEYALEKVELIGATAGCEGFISISNAAGMAGLKRIMPIVTSPMAIRNKVEYASKLVKGPLDIGFNLFANSATPGTDTVTLFLDFVKRRL